MWPNAVRRVVWIVIGITFPIALIVISFHEELRSLYLIFFLIGFAAFALFDLGHAIYRRLSAEIFFTIEEEDGRRIEVRFQLINFRGALRRLRAVISGRHGSRRR